MCSENVSVWFPDGPGSLLDRVGGLQVPGPGLEQIRLLSAQAIVEHEVENLQGLGGESCVLEPDFHESLVVVYRFLILKLSDAALYEFVDSSFLAAPWVFLLNPGNVPKGLKV